MTDSPSFDLLPGGEPVYEDEDPRWQHVFDLWLGSHLAAQHAWPVADYNDPTLKDDAISSAFRADIDSRELDIRRLSANECWRRYQLMLHASAAVLTVAQATAWFAADEGLVKQMEPITMLRWIARPPRRGARVLGFERDGMTALLYQLGVDDEGNLLLERMRPTDPSATAQLERLGVTSARTGPTDAVLPQANAASVVAFALVPTPDAPTRNPVTGPRTPAVRPDEVPDDIYSPLYIGLADDERGAPLEAVWHINWEAGGVWWLFLNETHEVEDVSHVPYKQRLSPADFRRALAGCIERGAEGTALPTFVTFGEQRGHCIYPVVVDDSRVTYLDPWPGRSLLAVNNNTYGVCALREDDTWKRWSVSIEEFDRVAYAAMVQARTWLDLCGIARTRSYTEFVQSDLFTFFHLREKHRAGTDSGTEITLEPGNWVESIALSLLVDDADQVVRARLAVDRGWLTAPATAPFAFDLVKSFVGATVVEVDLDESEPLIQALWMAWRGTHDSLESGSPHLLNQTRAVVLAVFGATPFGRMSLPGTTIRAANEGDDWSQTSGRLVLSVSAATREGGFLLEDLASGYSMDAYRLALAVKMQQKLQNMQTGH